jgi:7-carboxy-7-deazaguanine synthase
MKDLAVEPISFLNAQSPSEYGVMEHFHTLQGEGAWTGVAAYFIRLAGCDVGCHWCDVKESWDASLHPAMDSDALADAAEASGAFITVVTGGEPTLYQLDALTETLHQRNHKVHLETSGTHPLTGHFDWITFSPKKFKAPREEYYQVAKELKIIVHNPHDLVWAQQHAEKVNPETILYLQPEWYTPESAQWIVEFVKSNPIWRVSLQTHKYLHIP